MRHLMTDDRADAAVVESIIRFRIVKWRLQDSSGKNYLVELRIVISIDRRRRHAPFGPVHRLADLAEVTPEVEFAGQDRVVVVSAATHMQRFIVAPLVR